MNERTETFMLGTGVMLENVHNKSAECIQFGCAIHNPSNHAFVDLPLHWSPYLKMLVRLDEDNIFIPDPDELHWRKRNPDNVYEHSGNILMIQRILEREILMVLSDGKEFILDLEDT